MIARWRVAARVAWREVRRRPGRTVLVALLVALPVAAVTTVATTTRTTATTEERERDAMFGSADDVVSAEGPAVANPEGRRAFRAAVRDAYPPGTRIVDFAETPDAVVEPGGGLEQVELSDRPLDEPLLGRAIVLTGGRAPERPGEVAVSRSVLDEADADVGDRIRLFLAGTAEVTGTVVDRDYTDRLLVVGTEASATHQYSYRRAYVDTPGPDPVAGDPAVLLRAGATASGPVDETMFAYRRDDVRKQLAGDYVAAGVALAVTAIVAAAAFAVGTRRQLRTLGLLGAAGASPADLRRTVLLQGTAVGLVGSCAGAALGLALAIGSYPLLDDFNGRQLDGLRMHPVDLVVAAALGTLAATAAAWLPARSAGRTAVLSALEGRRPQGRLPWAVPVAGAAAVALGVAALAAWARRDDEAGRGWGWGLTAALAVLAGGTAIAPWLVTHAEPLAARLRGGGRLAARGLARQRLRSGAVVAAMMVPAGLTVFGATVAVTEQARDQAQTVARGPYELKDNEVLVSESGGRDDEVLAAVRAALPGATEVTARAAAAPGTDGPAETLLILGRGSPEAAVSTPREVFVITATQLRRLGAPVAVAQALDDGRVVLFGEAPDVPELALDTLPVTLGPDDLVVDRTTPVPDGDLHAYVSPETAERWGAVTVGAITLFRAPEPLTPGQQRAIGGATSYDADAWLRRYLRDPIAAETQADVTLGTWFRNPSGEDTAALRWAYVGASLLFTLLVAAVALALTASESADERGLLDAIGAPPSVRRSSMAWQAALLPAMAVVVAVPVGLIGAYAMKSSGDPGVAVAIPWSTVAAVLVGLPLATGGVTWLAATLTGRRRRDLSGLALADD